MEKHAAGVAGTVGQKSVPCSGCGGRLYPLRFFPVYKNYMWGGRRFETEFGRRLPDGIIAESWELACHKDGMSIVSNGEYRGSSLEDMMGMFGKRLAGSGIYERFGNRFPVIIKFLDAADRLSVQVHPGDDFAREHENGELGKTEMWYVIKADPGAKIVYGLKPGVTREDFINAIKADKIYETLNVVEVREGDVFDIRAGLVHALGAGIMVAEIQQNSNATYRVHDYGRVDARTGQTRPLHIDKAIQVIDFVPETAPQRVSGLKVKQDAAGTVTLLVSNKYFCVELMDIRGDVNETADGRRFYAYTVIKGEAVIEYAGGSEKLNKGDTMLIPAEMGEYRCSGTFTALRTTVPDL